MTNGFFLTLDALLCLVLFVAILFLVPVDASDKTLRELTALQKLHDLQKIWIHDGLLDMDEMTRDLSIVFPDNAFEIVLNSVEKSVRTHLNQQQKIESEVVMVKKDRTVMRLRIGLYYQ